jgi:hypothetical protein
MALAGVRGRLISAAFAEARLVAPGHEAPPSDVVRRLDAWADRCQTTLGPASSVRAITDGAVIPLLRILGYDLRGRSDNGVVVVLDAGAGDILIPLAVIGWSESLDGLWRGIVLDGIRADGRWAFCCNGVSLRVVDVRRTWNREYLEFDLGLVADDEAARWLLWNLVGSRSMTARPPALDRAVEQSARYGIAVRKALGDGVLKALTLVFGALAARRRQPAPRVLFEQALTVLYRILFLLFAEARALVPIWHPIYRDRYTINGIVTALLEGRRCGAIWNAILAISRLAHAGCRAGELTVTPFNGRLFSPAHSTAFDRSRIADSVLGHAVLAVGTTQATGVRARISYSDIDVEQLGAVYERVLEYEPGGPSSAALVRTRDVRRSSGTFYTPRAVTAHVVRRALAPLVRERTTEQILELRVLDPAMGSGAFLVAACRFLAAAAEQRLIDEGRWHRGDITASERAALRRQIAQRCLFGVDLNPMAVQLARLSLWLATLAADKPLTFLDHHLISGDSLLGADLDAVLRQPMGGGRAHRRPGALPLFEGLDAAPALEEAVRTRSRIALEPDDTPAAVSTKEKALAALHGSRSQLQRWSRVLDLWCSGWFWERGERAGTALFGELCDRILERRSLLPDRITRELLDHVTAVADRYRFLHWPLAFPEVFYDSSGRPLPDAGFDAVVGNPPWDMVRGDSGEGNVRADRRTDARRFSDFIRETGIYRVETRSHVNRYQLFVERALQLTRRGGRVGMVVPSGLVTDSGAAPLRRYLFDRASIDSLTGLDNRAGIFPIHRSLRFILLSATVGDPTSSIRCRFGVSTAEELERERAPVVITRSFVARLSGADDLGVPGLRTDTDLRIVEGISARWPWMGSAGGWHAEFGRELNATDDGGSFKPYSGAVTARPVLEGKQIEAFRTAVNTCRYELPDGTLAHRVPRRARLAYRDIASATNKLTLIAAVVPARAVTTHTLFCLRSRLSLDAQHVLCALLNSFVANYLIRLRVNTHVTVALVARLPMPVLTPRHRAFARMASRARALAHAGGRIDDMPEYAETQALAAHAYGVSEDDLRHILDTFPLISTHAKYRTMREFSQMMGLSAGVR